MTVANATMDVSVCREVLSNLIEALSILDERDPQKDRYRDLLTALPSYQTNAEGGLRKWMHPDLPDMQAHRHMNFTPVQQTVKIGSDTVTLRFHA